MHDSRQIKEVKLKMREKLPTPILKVLHPDEEVLKVMRQITLARWPKWLIITSKRIVYYDQKMLGRYELRDFPYSKIELILCRVGLLATLFYVRKEGGEELKIPWLKKTEIRSVFETIYNALNRVAIEPVSIKKKKFLIGEEFILEKPAEVVSRMAVTGEGAWSARSESKSVEERLRRLKELLEKGLITQEEYEYHRKRILESI